MKPAISFFSRPARWLHWSMAVLILAMLFIGVGMVASVSARHAWLVAMHKPLGMLALVLVILRIGVRWRHPPPALPEDLPPIQRWMAHLSHWLLYGLMLSLPLVGWAMLSAGGYPVMLTASLRLPAIVPAGATAFAWLRHLHAALALLLFATVLVHLAAALYHGWIRRDGVLASMLGRRGGCGTDPESGAGS